MRSITQILKESTRTAPSMSNISSSQSNTDDDKELKGKESNAPIKEDLWQSKRNTEFIDKSQATNPNTSIKSKSSSDYDNTLGVIEPKINAPKHSRVPDAFARASHSGNRGTVTTEKPNSAGDFESIERNVRDQKEENFKKAMEKYHRDQAAKNPSSQPFSPSNSVSAPDPSKFGAPKDPSMLDTVSKHMGDNWGKYAGGAGIAAAAGLGALAYNKIKKDRAMKKASK